MLTACPPSVRLSSAPRGEAMQILIIGATGMIGRKLLERLVRDGSLGGDEISLLCLADVAPPSSLAGGDVPVQIAVADLAEPGAAAKLLTGRPDVIIDLAAVVSGEAERDLAKG